MSLIGEGLSATRIVPRDVWRNALRARSERIIAEETAIALTYDRTTHAVMMATPTDLEDLGIGFSLSERIIDTADEIEDLEIVSAEEGIEVRMSLAPVRRNAFNQRRRHLAGPTGCGLCGIESLMEAMRPARRVRSAGSISSETVSAAVDALSRHQNLHKQTRSVHAAAYWQTGIGYAAVREDVGRHNALDKLIGAVVQRHLPINNGIVMVTSRVSVELVQKTAALGAPFLLAVSAPTALAVRACDDANITLVAVARGDGFEVFTHGERIVA